MPGIWLEWLTAQEIWRRAAHAGHPTPEQLCYWQSKRHELDYVVRPDFLVEVKRGQTSAMEFGCFSQVFPTARLRIVGKDRFEGRSVSGLPLAEFLRAESW